MWMGNEIPKMTWQTGVQVRALSHFLSFILEWKKWAGTTDREDNTVKFNDGNENSLYMSKMHEKSFPMMADFKNAVKIASNGMT